MAKLATNSSSATEINLELFWLKDLLKIWSQYPGSVVPLAMFNKPIKIQIAVWNKKCWCVPLQILRSILLSPTSTSRGRRGRGERMNQNLFSSTQAQTTVCLSLLSVIVIGRKTENVFLLSRESGKLKTSKAIRNQWLDISGYFHIYFMIRHDSQVSEAKRGDWFPLAKKIY